MVSNAIHQIHAIVVINEHVKNRYRGQLETASAPSFLGLPPHSLGRSRES